VVGALLIAHGLVHLLYIADDVPEFSAERSWVVPVGARRPVALTLIGATIVAFALVGLAVWGVPLLSAVWPTLTIVASVVSLVLLGSFWHPRVVLGVVIDIVLIAVAMTQPAWTTSIG
jgi:hypothetical protein